MILWNRYRMAIGLTFGRYQLLLVRSSFHTPAHDNKQVTITIYHAIMAMGERPASAFEHEVVLKT